MFLIYEEYVTQNECSAAVQHASELRTAICEIADSSCQSSIRYTVVMEEKQVKKSVSIFSCTIPLCGNDMNKEITTSLDTIISIR
jgi:Tfp pilus assembly major pilin PilA